MFLDHPHILAYNVQIDEAHERGVYTDLLLGVLKKYVLDPYGYDRLDLT